MGEFFLLHDYPFKFNNKQDISNKTIALVKYGPAMKVRLKGRHAIDI